MGDDYVPGGFRALASTPTTTVYAKVSAIATVPYRDFSNQSILSALTILVVPKGPGSFFIASTTWLTALRGQTQNLRSRRP